VTSLREAIRLDPNDVLAHAYLSAAYRVLGRHQEGIAVLREAIDLDQNSAWLHYLLGWSYRALGRYEEAVPVLQEAIRLDPEYAEAMSSWGSAIKSLTGMKRRSLRLRTRSG